MRFLQQPPRVSLCHFGTDSTARLPRPPPTRKATPPPRPPPRKRRRSAFRLPRRAISKKQKNPPFERRGNQREAPALGLAGVLFGVAQRRSVGCTVELQLNKGNVSIRAGFPATHSIYHTASATSSVFFIFLPARKPARKQKSRL